MWLSRGWDISERDATRTATLSTTSLICDVNPFGGTNDHERVVTLFSKKIYGGGRLHGQAVCRFQNRSASTIVSPSPPCPSVDHAMLELPPQQWLMLLLRK
jgi:hypothetical protein